MRLREGRARLGNAGLRSPLKRTCIVPRGGDGLRSCLWCYGGDFMVRERTLRVLVFFSRVAGIVETVPEREIEV